MHFPPSPSYRITIAHKLFLLTLGILSMLCWAFDADHAVAASGGKAKSKKKVVAAQRETIERGRLTSFQGGVLKFKVREPGTDMWKDREMKIASGTEVVSYIRGVATKGASPEAFKPWDQNPGVMIVVRLAGGKVRLVEIGSKKAPETTPKKPADEVAERNVDNN